MLHHVQGVVHSAVDSSVVLQVGAFGLQVIVPDISSFVPGKEVSLVTHVHWNADQGPTLYGFALEIEKIVFIHIISCSGIGPKIALALLKGLGAQQFLCAIVQERADILSKVTGVGGKKAEQLIMHLRGKAAKLMLMHDGQDTHEAQIMMDITQALTSLNYTQPEVASTVRHLMSNTQNSNASFDQLMRQALSFLVKKV